jgi:hypothetical protein
MPAPRKPFREGLQNALRLAVAVWSATDKFSPDKILTLVAVPAALCLTFSHPCFSKQGCGPVQPLQAQKPEEVGPQPVLRRG